MKTEALYLEIINNLCDGVYFVDDKRRITFWNKAAEDITGYASEEITGQSCQSNLLNHIDKDGRQLCLFGCPLYASLIDGRPRRAEVFLRHKEGHRIPVTVSIFPFIEDDQTVGAIEIFTPNSPTVYEDDLIERLSSLVMLDQLTGVANRRKVESFLEYRFHEMRRFQEKFCAIFLDIDNFGQFNNTYGHETGDEVLKSVAKSVMRSMRKDDMFGRWGGEEFIAVSQINNDYEATLIAEKLRMLIENTLIPYQGRSLSVTASLGATVARAGDTLETLVKRADELMYQSKQKGKNRVSSDV